MGIHAVITSFIIPEELLYILSMRIRSLSIIEQMTLAITISSREVLRLTQEQVRGLHRQTLMAIPDGKGQDMISDRMSFLHLSHLSSALRKLASSSMVWPRAKRRETDSRRNRRRPK